MAQSAQKTENELVILEKKLLPGIQTHFLPYFFKRKDTL